MQNNKMKTILITGAGGYIGTTLVPCLVAAGYGVIAVDTFWFGNHLPEASDHLTHLHRDVRDLVVSDFKGVYAVIDLAALSNDPCGESFTEATREINHLARVRTAELSRAAGVRHYILASSCSVYGFNPELRNERSEPNPLTVYACANLAAEKDLLSLQQEGFAITVLRLATLFGVSPRMRLDLVVNSMCYSAWRHREITISGGGTQIRPLLHVEDVAKTVVRVLNLDPDQHRSLLINVGSNDMNLSINDLAAQISHYFQSEHNTRLSVRHCGPQDLRSYRVDFSHLRRTLFWSPSSSVHSALGDIIKYLKSADSHDIARCHTLDWYQKHVGIDAIMHRSNEHAKSSS